MPAAFYEAVGYRPLGRIAVRADRLDRLASEARKRAAGGPFVADAALLSLVGCGKAEIAPLLAAVGYRPQPGEGEPRYVLRERGKSKARRADDEARAAARRAQSPFAALKELRFVR